MFLIYYSFLIVPNLLHCVELLDCKLTLKFVLQCNAYLFLSTVINCLDCFATVALYVLERSWKHCRVKMKYEYNSTACIKQPDKALYVDSVEFLQFF